jgi:hypothetical protein
MGEYVKAEIITSEAQLKEEALAKLKEQLELKGITGWVPNPASLQIIVLEILAGMAQNAAVVASTVLDAVFTQFGVQLLGLAFNEGAFATAATKWTIIAAEGVRQIPSGENLEAGGKGWETEGEVEVPAKATTVNVPIRAVERGASYNKVSGVAQQVNPLVFVSEVQIIGETTGGAEEETSEEYRSRLVAQLRLQAPRPVNAEDFPPFLQGAPESVAGALVTRATAIDLYNAETAEENVPNCCTTWVVGAESANLTTPEMEALQAWVRKYLPLNFLAFVRAPAEEKIYITFNVHVLASYNPETVVANARSSLVTLVSRKRWGNPTGQETGATAWINETKVRYNTILGAIEAVPGIAYVFPGAEGLKIGTTASPTSTADITLSGGPVVLPETSLTTVLGSYE